MEKDNKFKLKLPRFFTSCKTQDLSQVVDHQNPIFTPKNTTFHQTPPTKITQDEENNNNNPSLSSSNIINKPKLTPSLLPSSSSSSSSSPFMYCKPRCPETFDQMIRENCIIATTGNPFSRRKIAGKYSLLSHEGDFSGGGRRCPPASPATPLFYPQKQGRKPKKKRKNDNFKGKNSKTENTLLKKMENQDQIMYYSSNETDIDDMFSSDDERETETLFSLKSLSFSSKTISFSSDDDGDESGPDRSRTRAWARSRKPGSISRPKPRKGGGGGGGGEVGVVPLEGKVKDTFAVVKSSSDPYNDFRASMAEMIIEKQIFGAKELEELLQCFLSLNSPHHHKVIVDVFTEIWEVLFSHFS